MAGGHLLRGLVVATAGAVAVVIGGVADPVGAPEVASPGPPGGVPVTVVEPLAAGAEGLLRPPPTRDARLGAASTSRLPAPTRVVLARLGIDAPVDAVGVDATGALAVPPSNVVAAWYRVGPAPGEAGSAVVAAHVDYHHRPGPFFRLREAVAGDLVDVTAADGSVRRFAVTSVRRAAKADLTASGAFRATGSPVLTLVTCGGDFRPAVGSYADNVVVEARPA